MKITRTCGECDCYKKSENESEKGKGNCYLAPPVVKVIATPTQDMTGAMNLQINNVQTRPIVAANEKACGQAAVFSLFKLAD